MLRIDAELLIPGAGEPVSKGCVIAEDDVIVYAGPSAGAPNGEITRTFEAPVVMPGMWDCHGHFIGARRLDLGEVMRTPPMVIAARAVGDARAALDAGFTSIREAGGVGIYLARVINEGLIEGPNIYGPGAILSQTGGHGDLHEYRLRWMHDLAEAGGFFCLCDGVAECLKAVRTQLRHGAAIIKVCASGGVMSQLDDPIHQQFTDEELEAIVGEASRFERVVMAHCHGKPGIMAAIRAGCKTIEHGTYLDEEVADRMIETDTILVPTRFIIERLPVLGREHGLPDYAYRKAVGVADQHKEALELAVAKGVRIAAGTDIATSGPDSGVPWGMNGHELRHLVAAGMTPLQAIAAATATAPLTLGPQAPKTGQLRPGFDADIIAVSADPLEDIEVLAEPKNVTMVFKSGALVKNAA